MAKEFPREMSYSYISIHANPREGLCKIGWMIPPNNVYKEQKFGACSILSFVNQQHRLFVTFLAGTIQMVLLKQYVFARQQTFLIMVEMPGGYCKMLQALLAGIFQACVGGISNSTYQVSFCDKLSP